MIAIASAGAAAAVAEAKRRQEYEEEEEVTPMSTNATGAVEYKILRSATSAFRDRARFQSALEEESKAGWELVEKLDDTRVRLRRSIDCRKDDSNREQDPYRTWVGMGQATLALWVIFGVLFGTFAIIGAVIGIVVLANK